MIRLVQAFQPAERRRPLRSLRYASPHEAWSDAIGEGEALAGQLQQVPARSLLDLSLKFDALLWEVSHYGPDEDSIDKLQVWGDELRLMAGIDTHS